MDADRLILANSAKMRAPLGHYSHVCIANGIAYVSGQLPLDVQGNPLIGQPFDRQAEQVLSNLDLCLEAAGTSKERLIQVRVYITDMSLWSAFNEIYGRWIGSHRPARAVAGVASLHFGLSLEVEAVALV